MGIADIFRPKHRHSDAAIRATAVNEIDEENTQLLTAIAQQDRDLSVRQAAMNKLDDPEVLVTIAKGETNDSLKSHAMARAITIWVNRGIQATDSSQLETSIQNLIAIDAQDALATLATHVAEGEGFTNLLAHIHVPEALAKIVRSSISNQGRLAALAKLDQTDQLLLISISDTSKVVALAALERITDIDALRTIETKGKTKTVRARAREKLALITKKPVQPPPQQKPTQQKPTQQKRVHAEQIQLCQQVEKSANGNEWTRSYQIVKEAQKAWEGLAAHLRDPSLQERFDNAVQLYQAKRKKYALRPSSTSRPLSEKPTDPANATAASTSEQAPSSPISTNTIEKNNPATNDASAPPAIGAVSSSINASSPDPEEAKRTRKNKILSELERLTAELERARTTTKRKFADRKLKEATTKADKWNLSGIDKDAISRFHTARQALFVRVQELQEADEWKRWANVPRCEALIEETEKILQDPDNTDIAAKLQTVQTQWKNVGPIPHHKNRELWEKFKENCDQIFERVKTAREQLQQQRAENLAHKRKLCEQAEALMDSTDWEQTAQAFKRLQRDWKVTGPVSRKQAEPLWKRFRTACDTFFERRTPHLQKQLAEQTENLHHKESLCEQIEKLVESTDPEQAKKTLHKLQSQWRRTGPVPRKHASAINSRFRTACSEFLAREKHKQTQQQQQHKDKLELLRTQLEELQTASENNTESREQLVPRILEVRSELLQISKPEECEPLLDLFRSICQPLVNLEADAFQGTELDLLTSRRRKHKLCTRAEKLLEERQAQDLPQDTPGTVADKLRAAIANNAFKDIRASQETSVTEIVAELRQSWQRSGPVPEPERAELQQRFDRACDALLATESPP